MAEFQEVMRQFNRMCEFYHSKSPCPKCCTNCPLNGSDGISERCKIDAFVNDSEWIEREIMSWAAEHPEPVYPTWYEYLNKMYGAAFGDLRVIGRQPISADIAQKLGIEPKEVQNGKAD